MRILWKIIRFFLVLVGLFVVAIVGLGVWAFHGKIEPRLPDRMALVYAFKGTPQDAPAKPGWLMQFGGAEPTLSEVTSAIARAATDDRVTSLAVQLQAGAYDWAAVQELQAAIKTFRDAGKMAYVYADSYGDLYPGMAEYYLASSFDEIWLQPVGNVAITGFAIEQPYIKAALERLGIVAEVTQRGDYKTAPEGFIREHMSDQERETWHGIMSSMMTDFFDGVSKGRNLPIDRIGQLIDGAPYTADEAKDRKLVDVVGYQDELIDKISPGVKKNGEDIVNLVDYYDSSSSLLKTVKAGAVRQPAQGKSKDIKGNGKSVALVYVTGMILPGSGMDRGPFADPAAMADDIAWDIQDAANDDDVGAIVVRVDSPGGSPSASETIRRAIEVAKGKGKYVVVSMGSTAASGGYWVSVDADKIYAMPGTLTGSIGVFGGKPDLSAMWGKLDVNWDSVKLGANAGMWSPNRSYDTEGRAAVDRMMDDIYDGFIARVAKGRGFSEDVVEAMAQGRVWTGRQAKERGLVDGLGGLEVAFDDVAGHLGIARADMDVYVLPDGGNPLEQMLGFISGGTKIFSIFRQLSSVLMLHENPEWGIALAPNPLR